MSKPEHILRQEGAINRPELCTCDDGYWMRNLIDPQCHYHGGYAEELRALITELSAVVDGLAQAFGTQSYDNLIQRAREATK